MIRTIEKQHERPFKNPIVPNVAYNAELLYAIGKAVTFFKEGIGVPRRGVARKGEDYIPYTPYNHSYETHERYTGIMNHFADTVLGDVKHIHQIKKKHVKTYFDNMINKCRKEKTVKLNASALIKLFNAFSRKDLIEYIDKSRSTWVRRAMPSSRTTPFGDPGRVIDKMRGEAFKAAATIQYKTGATVSDIPKVVDSVISHPSRTSIPIMRSKGGRDRILDLSDRMPIFDIVLESVKVIQIYLSENNNDWSSFQIKYTDAVHRAAKKAGEIYCGTRAFLCLPSCVAWESTTPP